MEVIYNKNASKLVFEAFKPLIKNKTCPYCDTKMHLGNFAGVITYKEEARFVCGALPCLLQIAQERKEAENERK